MNFSCLFVSPDDDLNNNCVVWTGLWCISKTRPFELWIRTTIMLMTQITCSHKCYWLWECYISKWKTRLLTYVLLNRKWWILNSNTKFPFFTLEMKFPSAVWMLSNKNIKKYTTNELLRSPKLEEWDGTEVSIAIECCVFSYTFLSHLFYFLTN